MADVMHILEQILNNFEKTSSYERILIQDIKSLHSYLIKTNCQYNK